MLAIGAVSRATGIPVETLRTWERRYGFKGATRRPSGHRVYPLSVVARLRRISQALALGHRPADVMRCTDPELEALLGTVLGPGVAAPPPAPRRASGRGAPRSLPAGVRDLLAATARFDRMALRAGLEAEAARRTPLAFLEEVVGPFMIAVGKEWSAGRLEVRHEHFAAACVSDVLRARRRPLESESGGPFVAVAGLPGDRHEIGLLMASLVLADAGLRVIYLGPETPAEQLIPFAREAGLAAVAVGISPTAPADSVAQSLRDLAAGLPPHTRLVLGGSGAPRRVPGATRVADLEALSRWARQEAAGDRGRPGGAPPPGPRR